MTISSVRELNLQVKEEAIFLQDLLAEINKVMVGQEALVERVLIALLADGHILLEGVPGLAKTLLISTLAQILDLKFNRIQFTPDLMPSDITGTEIIEEAHSTGKREFRLVTPTEYMAILGQNALRKTLRFHRSLKKRLGKH